MFDLWEHSASALGEAFLRNLSTPLSAGSTEGELANGVRTSDRLGTRHAVVDADERLKIVRGPSRETLPLFHRAHPEVQCDIISVDGDHSYEGAVIDVANLRYLARGPGHDSRGCSGSAVDRDVRSSTTSGDALGSLKRTCEDGGEGSDLPTVLLLDDTNCDAAHCAGPNAALRELSRRGFVEVLSSISENDPSASRGHGGTEFFPGWQIWNRGLSVLRYSLSSGPWWDANNPE
jgi:hypothetical protein